MHPLILLPVGQDYIIAVDIKVKNLPACISEPKGDGAGAGINPFLSLRISLWEISMDLVATSTSGVIIFVTAGLPGVNKVIHKMIVNMRNRTVHKKPDTSSPSLQVPREVCAVTAIVIVREYLTEIFICYDVIQVCACAAAG